MNDRFALIYSSESIEDLRDIFAYTLLAENDI